MDHDLAGLTRCSNRLQTSNSDYCSLETQKTGKEFTRIDCPANPPAGIQKMSLAGPFLF